MNSFSVTAGRGSGSCLGTETLQHVTTHPDLDDVRLFLAGWGYNSEAARTTPDADPRIRWLVRAGRLWHRLSRHEDRTRRGAPL